MGFRPGQVAAVLWHDGAYAVTCPQGPGAGATCADPGCRGTGPPATGALSGVMNNH